jgi:hypothetical protein
MEYVLGETTGLISYFSLGILFFLVIWSFVEKVPCQIFRGCNIGRLLGLLLATYGFWYPFIPFLRIPYLVLLAAVSVVGTALSRFGIVSKWSIQAGKTSLAGIVILLVAFDSLQYILPAFLVSSGYWTLGKMISWGLLVYGIYSAEMIGAVVKSSGLPRSNSIIIAFVLACVIFLPIEFPFIYTLMSLSAVLGTLLGWISTREHGW